MRHSRCWIAMIIVAMVGIALWNAINARGTRTGSVAANDLATGSVNLNTGQARTMRKLVIPEDPREREAVLKKYWQQQAAADAIREAEARARARQWRGCRFVANTQSSSDKEYAQLKDAADILSANQTVPQARLDFFHSILSAKDFNVVGWEGFVVTVSDTPEGKRVVLNVQPTLTTCSGGGAVFTPLTCRETWLIDKMSQLTMEKAEDGGGVAVIMID
jgi:hypothetical protein